MKQISFLLIVLFIVPLFSQDGPGKFTIRDYLSQTSIRSPQFSPDGKTIAYVIGEKEKWDAKRINNIWLVNPDGSGKKQLTNSQKADWHPRWSPDGKRIAFLSARSKKTQVYLININGGEARKITSAKRGVSQFAWIDNLRIAYVTSAERDSLIIAREDSAGGGYVVGTKAKKSELWIQPLAEKSKAKKVTGGKYYISDFSPAGDGDKFALIIAPDSDQFNYLMDGKVLVIDKAGKELFAFKEAKVFSDVDFSPDNKKISFIGNTVGYSANNALFVSDLKSKETKNLTADFDPTIEAVEWLDKNTVTFKTPRNVYSGIYRVNLKGKIKPLLEPHWVVGSYSLNPKVNKIVFTASRGDRPAEMYVNKFAKKPQQARSLTQVNKWITKKELASTKIIRYPSFDGQMIEAVLALPPDYSKDKKYPLLVFPHGGPDGIVTDRFHIFHQLFALNGMIVFRPNFRGGIGYGSKFYAANRGKLGDIDYKDIMAGVDYLIKTEAVDTAKLVVGGWSYGGYMTDWIIGHSQRFKAAVSVAGVANTVSMYAQSDINHGDIARWEFKGVPVLNIENFQRSSPFHFLKNCTTPTLILHGEADTRVPVMQSWELYRALVDLQVEVQMVLYPGATHGIRPPKQFADVMTRWLEWYQKHLNTK